MQAAGAKAGAGLFDLALDFLDDGLHGAGDEGQADKDQRDEDPPLRIGNPPADFAGQMAQNAIGRIKRRQGNAGHGGGQGKGQINGGIKDAAARKAVAHQNPGQQNAEHQIEQRRKQGKPERQEQGGPDALAVDGVPDARKAEAGALPQKGADGKQDDKAQHRQGDPHAERQPGHGGAVDEGPCHFGT